MPSLSISLADAQTQLDRVNIAIQSIIDGKRLNSLEVGSGSFARKMTFQEINMETLRQLQKELLDDLAYYNNSTGGLPNFANHKSIPIVVRKDYFNSWAGRGIY